jgi:glycosyltransferase involved in cell wall biosynthesis
MTVPPDVSIVVPTRNRPDRLERALDSVARQTLRQWEALVVDDGSEADHRGACEALLSRLGPRFQSVQGGAPSRWGSGPAISRNRGLEAAHGRYVAFLDDDDTWIFDEHLRVAVDALDQTGSDVYCGNMEGFRGDVVAVASWLDGGGPVASAQRVTAKPEIY